MPFRRAARHARAVAGRADRNAAALHAPSKVSMSGSRPRGLHCAGIGATVSWLAPVSRLEFQACVSAPTLSAFVSLCLCRTGVVPKDVKGMVRQLLVTEGPMMQSQFLPKWRKMFPDNQFDLVTWGFERLTAALEALPDLVVITKDGPKKSFLSLKGGPPPPIGGAAADVAAPKGAGMSREVMTGVVAGVIASKGSVDPARISQKSCIYSGFT